MKILVTGSSGHLGEALMRILPGLGHEPKGLDIKAGEFTQVVGSVCDPDLVKNCSQGMDAILHCATLHKPHVVTHRRQLFVDTNISGTLNLLEAAVENQIQRFVYSSTTSTFGTALTPAADSPAIWVDESVRPTVKNIYGITKLAAENLCELFARKHDLNCTVLRLSRFFPEEDDNRQKRVDYSDDNSKANEFLYRRVDLEDAAMAHVCAMTKSANSSFSRYIISAPSPFTRKDLIALRTEPSQVVEQYFPEFREIYERLNYRMFDDIERVYVSEKAQLELGWKPEFDFARVLGQLHAGEQIGSQLAEEIGAKGYHSEAFSEGPYPVE